MATIREYERRYRDMGYSVTAARSRARADRSEEVANQRQRKEAFDAAYQESQERIREIRRQRRGRDFKNPTNTEYPENGWPHPRSERAQYDPVVQTLSIWWDRPGKWGDHTEYYDVPPQIWEQVKVTPSTGKYVNAVLNGYRFATMF